MESLPLPPAGKIDLDALPAPGEFDGGPGIGAVAPYDLVEMKLAGIWSNALHTPDVGVHDDFFELGGHSVLAVRLMAAIHKAFGPEFPVSTLIQGPTIEQQANLLRRKGDAEPWTPLVCIQPGGDREPFFRVHPVGGNVMSYMTLAREMGNRRPFYGLQSPGIDNGEPLESVEEMSAAYVEAIRGVQPHGPYHLGAWSLGGVVACEMVRQFEKEGEKTALLALVESYTPVAAARLERLHIKEKPARGVE